MKLIFLTKSDVRFKAIVALSILTSSVSATCDDSVVDKTLDDFFAAGAPSVGASEPTTTIILHSKKSYRQTRCYEINIQNALNKEYITLASS